jgi:hypothetical protein
VVGELARDVNEYPVLQRTDQFSVGWNEKLPVIII